jgi:hypothetical protein
MHDRRVEALRGSRRVLLEQDHYEVDESSRRGDKRERVCSLFRMAESKIAQCLLRV